MKTRSGIAGGATNGTPMHLTTGATDSYVRPVETVTINGVTVRKNSASHMYLLNQQAA